MSITATASSFAAFRAASDFLSAREVECIMLPVNDTAVTEISCHHYVPTYWEVVSGAEAAVSGVLSLSAAYVETPEVKFQRLIAGWHEEARFSSSPIDIINAPAYQSIIGMGPAALPLIFRQMELEGDKPDHWSWALQAISGENPVPEEAWGDLRATAAAWFDWARRRNVW